MEEKEKIKEVYEKLTDENKKILNMVAQGMTIAQENSNEEILKHIPRID